MKTVFDSFISTIFYSSIILASSLFSSPSVSAGTLSQYLEASKACSEKIGKLVQQKKEVLISSLNTDGASLIPRERDQNHIANYYYELKLPLRKSEGKIEAVWFHAELEEALAFLRFARQGKIRSVLVSSTYSDADEVLARMFPSELSFIGRADAEQKIEDSLSGIEACKEEAIVNKMKYCQECRIIEWRGVSP